MKNAISLILSMTLALSLLTACGGQSGGAAQQEAQNSQETQTQQETQIQQETQAQQEEQAEEPEQQTEEAGDPNLIPDLILEDFLGVWEDQNSQRATMEIVRSQGYGDAEVTITWGNGAMSTIIWSFTAAHDPEAGRLYYTNGVKKEVTFKEGGAPEEVQELWDDAEGEFTFNEDAYLTWTDSKDSESTSCRFIRIEEPEEPQQITLEDYLGSWQDETSQRATMEIVPTQSNGLIQGYGDAQVTITWGGSAWDCAVWKMSAAFDPDSGRLYYANGMKAEESYNDDGTLKSSEELWDDAEGAFTFNADGSLFWTDTRETASSDCRFTRMPAAEVAPAQG